jgi:simple sugar transport system substrate-binding protein
VSGARVAAEITRLVPLGQVVIFAPAESHSWTERRLEGILGGLSRIAKAPSATTVRLGGDLRRRQQKIESTLAGAGRAHGVFAVDGLGTLAIGRALKQRGGGAIRGGGYDLLPGDLRLVADGTLDFVVDQQPYVQGFTPVLQLFLARMSEGTVVPWDTETSLLLRKADVQAFTRTKSRFEGSSSRHKFPLRRE